MGEITVIPELLMTTALENGWITLCPRCETVLTVNQTRIRWNHHEDRNEWPTEKREDYSRGAVREIKIISDANKELVDIWGIGFDFGRGIAHLCSGCAEEAKMIEENSGMGVEDQLEHWPI